MAAQYETSKSDVLRRGIRALERELTDPAAHPALRLIALERSIAGDEAVGYDLAVEHDRFLTESEEAGWRRRPEPVDKRKRKRGKRDG